MECIKIDISVLYEYKNQSVFAYCRQLLKDGVNPNARLEVYRNNKDHYDFCVSSIADGSKWTTTDNDLGGLKTVKYRPFKAAIGPRTCV